MEQYVVVSYFAPRDYLHVYGIYTSKGAAQSAMQEMRDEQVKTHGEFNVRKTTKFWVKKIIDVSEMDALNMVRSKE
jgi:hypothetical protein